jgi:hypothetical protein
MQRTRAGGGDQRSFEKIKVFFKNQKHEPNIVEVTHMCIVHKVHTSSNKFQIFRFWKEKSVENMMTLEGFKPFNLSMISFHIQLFKKSIHTLQNNVHMLSFPILQWVFTLGPTA